MRKEIISIGLSDNNQQFLNEFQHRMELPNRTVAINMIMRLAEMTYRWLEAGDGLNKYGEWKVPPPDKVIAGMTEQERTAFFKTLTERMNMRKFDRGILDDAR